MRKFTIILFMMVFCIGISAQSDDVLTIHDDELIAYIRIVDGQEEYVARYGEQRIVYSMPTDKCFRYSNDWRYLAVFEEGGNMLEIFSLSDNRLIIQDILTGIQFKSCALVWMQDNKTILVPMDDLNFYPAYIFYFDGITLTRLNDVNEHVSPELPNYSPDKYIFNYSKSPNPDIFLYNGCVESICGLLVYDLAQNLIIEELEPVDIYFLNGYYTDYTYGFENPRLVSISAPLVGWSYDARYLAFCDCEGFNTRETRGFIKIYDLQMDTYIVVDTTYHFNFDKEFSWSDNAHILAMWIRGGYGGDADTDSLNYLRFFNLNSNSYVNAQSFFDVLSSRGVVWSPGSRAVAILANERTNPDVPYEFTDSLYYPADLILIDTTTGEHTVIDTDVTDIITWRYLCDNPTPQDEESCADN